MLGWWALGQLLVISANEKLVAGKQVGLGGERERKRGKRWTRLTGGTGAHGGLEDSNGGRSTTDRGRASVGLEKRDKEEERQGLAFPLLPCPRPLVVAELFQRPV